MDRREIGRLRGELARFLAGDDRVFRFAVECPLSERVGFIYEVIFPGAARYRFYLRFALARLAQAIDYSPIKVFLYRRIGISIGKGVFIAADVIIDVHFPSLVVIGDHAILGWGARLFTHEFSGGEYRIGRIRIGEGALVGAFATVRGGVAVGREAEVGYCGRAFRDVPDGVKAVRVDPNGRESRG